MSGDIGDGVVSDPLTYSRDELWRAVLHFLSWPVDCETQVDGVPFEEKVGDVVRSTRLIPQTRCQRTTSSH